MKITASYLYAKEKYNSGNNNCYYCGLKCNDRYLTEEYVKKTFTNRDIIKYPRSKFVCGCCVDAMNGKGTTIQIDGTKKEGIQGAARCYSWILTNKEKYAFTKKHLYFAREKCLNPPTPPFAIILSDSARKQLIFRAPVNHDRDNYKLLLEENEIFVNVDQLKEYLNVAINLCKYIGKIQLKNPENFNNYRIVFENHGSEKPIVNWIKIYFSPLGQLSAWLCPNKKECENGIIIS